MYKLTKREWVWAMYDFGNSAYALIVITIEVTPIIQQLLAKVKIRLREKII